MNPLPTVREKREAGRARWLRRYMGRRANIAQARSETRSPSSQASTQRPRPASPLPSGPSFSSQWEARNRDEPERVARRLLRSVEKKREYRPAGPTYEALPRAQEEMPRTTPGLAAYIAQLLRLGSRARSRG